MTILGMYLVPMVNCMWLMVFSWRTWLRGTRLVYQDHDSSSGVQGMLSLADVFS